MATRRRRSCVGVLVGTPPEDGRDLVPRGGQLADEPRSRERAAAREEDFHRD